MGEKHKGLANAASILYSVLIEMCPNPAPTLAVMFFPLITFIILCWLLVALPIFLLTPGCKDFIKSTRLEDIHTSTQAE